MHPTEHQQTFAARIAQFQQQRVSRGCVCVKMYEEPNKMACSKSTDLPKGHSFVSHYLWQGSSAGGDRLPEGGIVFENARCGLHLY